MKVTKLMKKLKKDEKAVKVVFMEKTEIKITNTNLESDTKV